MKTKIIEIENETVGLLKQIFTFKVTTMRKDGILITKLRKKLMSSFNCNLVEFITTVENNKANAILCLA